jgi:hypothetical protein
MKYQKPRMLDYDDLTPALGFCSTGFGDGGCGTGTSAGGAQGCIPGTLATVGCATGSKTFGGCSIGNSPNL